MKKHWQYAKYLCRHKWFVFVHCVCMGIPFLGILHDWTKLLPDEWFPYCNYFYGDEPDKEQFNLAWLKHQWRTKHHWQKFVLQEDSGNIQAMPMPLRYRKEMLADWLSFGGSKLTAKTQEWYKANRHRMILHPETSWWIERELGLLTWSVLEDTCEQ